MGFETQGYDEYGSSMPPETSDEYDRTIDSIDMQMTTDAGDHEQTEAQIVADALGSLGLGELGQNDALGEMIPSENEDIAPVETQEPPAETREVPITAKPVVEVVEPSNQRQVETTKMVPVRAAGCDCVSSCISSGLVYKASDGVTPEMDRANYQRVMAMRRKFETLGSPPDEQSSQLVLRARGAINEYSNHWGINVEDRLPPLTLYRSGGEIDNRGARCAAVSLTGVGIFVNANSIYKDLSETERLFVLTHETVHHVSLAIMSQYGIDDRAGMLGVPSWQPYETRTWDESGIERRFPGFLESVTDLVAVRSLGFHPPLCVRPIDTLLHGVIEKAAEYHNDSPAEVSHAAARGLLIGRIGILQGVRAALSDRGKDITPFLTATGEESYAKIREIACQLDLPVTVDLVDNRRQGSLRRLFDWR
ncbi:MAG TPA: hypothetical protein VF809_00230 [Candidatus Saccharimonadales bacterium]